MVVGKGNLLALQLLLLSSYIILESGLNKNNYNDIAEAFKLFPSSSEILLNHPWAPVHPANHNNEFPV